MTALVIACLVLFIMLSIKGMKYFWKVVIRDNEYVSGVMITVMSIVFIVSVIYNTIIITA